MNIDMEILIERVENELNLTPAKAISVIESIRANVRNYVEANNLKSLILGVSGGLDSAVIAALLQEKYTGVPLIGISIPMNSTEDHLEKANWVGNTFCSAYEEFYEWDGELVDQIGDEFIATRYYSHIFDTLKCTNALAERAGFNPESFPERILLGNLKARLRMITLYDLARKTNGIVLSTDNWSEMVAGFFTLCGDVGDFSPIQNITKGFELPIIAKELGVREDIITQKPSDGLMVTDDNTDEAQLGGTYKEFDAIMLCYLNMVSNKDTQMLFEKIVNYDKNPTAIGFIKRYEATHFKRNWPIQLYRNQIGL